ncbi:uro-adherence factor A-like [Pleurodeles waltl]|uniref:uro-adherence factor A-like n=1 Tax=Pleurodeles waltl TaxID=8319 RepID=UPI003709A405
MAAVGTVSEEAAKGGRNRLPRPNARALPPSRRMSLPNLKDAFSGTARAYCQIQPARPVLKDKGNLPKECLRPFQRPPEKQNCRKGEICTEVKKVCPSGKPSLAGSLKPRRNSTGEIGKNLYSYFENHKMEAMKRSKIPLDSTWVRKDSDSSQKMEDSASHETSTAASECGSSVGSTWSRTFVVLDDEGNEVFPDTLSLNSHGEVQDNNVAQEEVPTVESAQQALNCELPNCGSTVTFQHLFPPGAIDTNSILPKSRYFPDCQSANPSAGDALNEDNRGPACKYFGTPVAATKPKGKIQLTPVMEVDLELSSSEAGSATEQQPRNLTTENECVRKRFPDILQHTTSNHEEPALTTPLYRSFFAAECMEIVCQIAGGKLPGGRIHQPSSDVSAGPQSSKRKRAMFDWSTIEAEPLPYDLTPMKSMLSHDADKVIRSLDSTPAPTDGSFFGGSILDLDNMNLQLLEFGDEGVEERKQLSASKEALDSEPSGLSKISLASSDSFRGLKDLSSFEGLDVMEVAPRQPASICSLHESVDESEPRALVDSSLNSTVDLHVPATSALLNTTVTHTPAVQSNQLANGSVPNAVIPVKLDAKSSDSQDPNLTVTKAEKVTAMNKTQDLFVTTLEVGAISPYKKSEIKVVHLLNTTQDIGQTSHLESAERNFQINVTQDIVLSGDSVDVTEEIMEEGNTTRDLGDINCQDHVNEGNTTRDLVASKHQNFLDGNTTRDLGDKRQDSVESNTTRDLGDNQNLEDGGNTTRDLGDNNQDLEDCANKTRDLQDIKYQDLKDLENATRDIVGSNQQDTLGVETMARDIKHQDLGDRRNMTIDTDTQNQEASTPEYSANATHDLGSAKIEVILEVVVSSHTTSEKEVANSKAGPLEEVVRGEANLVEDLENGEAINKVEGQNENKLEEAVKFEAEVENLTVQSDATTENILVKSEAKLQDVVAKGEPTPDEVPSSTLEAGLGGSANARSVEGEQPYHHRPLDRLSSGDTSLVLHTADSSRRSIELTHNESCFSAGSLSFVTSTPLPGAVAFQFTKGSCSDSMQSNASSLHKFPNLSICSVPEESDFEVSETSKRKSTAAKKGMDRTAGKSIGKSTVYTARISNLQHPANSSQRNLSRAEVPSKTPLASGIPGARRALALTSTVEKPRVSRETLTTKLPIGGARIPTMTKTSSKSSLTNGKSGLPKSGIQSSTQKPSGTSFTNLPFEVQRTSSSVLGEQASKNEGTPPPDLEPKLAQVTFDAGSAQPVKPSSMMKPPSASKLYRFRGGARAPNRSIHGGTVGGEKTFVGGTPAHDSRPSMAGIRTAEDKMSLQAQRAPDSRMSMGPPRNTESRMPLRPPRAADTRVSGAPGVPNIRMSVGPQQASDSRVNFVAPRDPDIRMLTPRGPESRMSLGAPRGPGSRMSLAGLRPPSGKMSFGLPKPPDSRLTMITTTTIENKLSVAVTREPLGSAIADSRASIPEAQGSQCAATPDSGLTLGGLRPQLYSSKGICTFGIRPPAASAIASVSGAARNGLSVRPPGLTLPKSPASESVSPKKPDLQAASEGAAVPNDDGQAAKRKLSSLPAPRSIMRSGLKPPSKSKPSTLNPSPKRPRLAPPNLYSEPSTSKRPSPGPEKVAAYATPAKLETPGPGIKPFKRSPLIVGKPNASSQSERKACPETEVQRAEAESVSKASAVVEESVTEQESIHRSHSATEERRAGLQSIHEDPCTMEKSPTKSAMIPERSADVKDSVIVAAQHLWVDSGSKEQSAGLQSGNEAPCTKEELMAEPEATHATSAAGEELRAGPETMHANAVTAEGRRDGLELIVDIPSMKVESMTLSNSTLQTPNIIEGANVEMNSVCRPTAVNESSAVPKHFHQALAPVVEPMTESGSLHTISSAAEEQGAQTEPTPQTPVQEQSVFLELIHTTPVGVESRNGQETVPKTPTLMEELKTELQKSTAAMEEPSSGQFGGSKSSPTKAKSRTESESFYITPPTSKKVWPTLDSMYNKTPFAMAKQITESASFYKTPATFEKQINNVTPAFVYRNLPASDKSKSDPKTNLPPWMMKKQTNGPHSSLNAAETEEKASCWMESIHESTLTEPEPKAGPKTMTQTLSSTTAAQKENTNFVLSPSPNIHKLHTEVAAIRRSPSKNDKVVTDEDKTASNIDETITDLGSIHRTPHNSEKSLSSGITQNTLSSPAHPAFDSRAGENNGADSVHGPVHPPPATKTDAAQVTGGTGNIPGELANKLQPAPDIEGCTRTTFENDSTCPDFMEHPGSGKTHLDQELEEVKRELAERDIQCEQYVLKVRTLEAQCEKYKRKLHLLVTRCECQDLELSLPSPGLEGERPPETAFKVTECSLEAPGRDMKNSPRNLSQEVEQPLESMSKVVEQSLLILKREMEKSPKACFQEGPLPSECSSKVEDCSLKTPGKDMATSSITHCKGEALAPGDQKLLPVSEPQGGCDEDPLR